MGEPKEYKHIVAWGKFMGSQDYYIEGEQEKAAQMGAPLDAVYYSYSEKKWITYVDIRNFDVKDWIRDFVKEM